MWATNDSAPNCRILTCDSRASGCCGGTTKINSSEYTTTDANSGS